jgi:hypothetical protein
VDLASVVPEKGVSLRQQLKCSERARRVSLHLVDDQGQDRGSLGEAAISAEPKES